MLANLFHQLLHGFSSFTNTIANINPAIRAPLAIAFGAIPGALSRYYLTLLLTHWLGTNFPYGTFVVNLTGALVMGFFTTSALERNFPSPDLRLLIAVGFLGSYTTFSTYALDTTNLLHSGQKSLALLYWLGSAGCGLLSLGIGSFLARRLF